MVRQLKKLTDCPENLRESIDWLIQVRHGNGEHGLKNLAEALKKLIGDAIKNASESLNDRQKELLCADKSSAGLYDNHCQKLQKGIDDAKKSEAEISKLKKKKADHYNEVHYLTEDARLGALDDIDARRISLGTLAGQLMGFIGSGQEVKDALLKGLHSNVTQLEKLLNASCGGEGCNCNIMNFRDGPLKNLQNKFNEVDKIEREIEKLNKQKEIAEKSKASGRTPSGSGPEIERLEKEIQENEEKLQKEKSLLEEQIKKLQDALSVPKKEIESLISKLQKSVAELEKQIEAERQKQIEDLQNKGYKEEEAKKYVSIPSHLSSQLETEQAKLKSHKASLESLQSLDKLITFHQSVDSDKNGKCKDILDNLCTGLEKFLGYHDGNYTGSGIVYSDLDRLCDGVMAFLHGVLNEVYKNDNLQKYKNPLTEPLRRITDDLYNRNNFDSSIVEVGLGVEEWLRGINASNEKIMTPLNELQRTIKGHMSSRMDRQTITDQLKNWKGIAGLYLGYVMNSEKAVQMIDDNLANKIGPKMELIRQVLQCFWTSANDGAVTDFVTQLENKFSHQHSEVKSYIARQINEVDRILKEKFSSIEKNINSLRQAKEKNIQSISEAVEAAKGLADTLVGDKSNGFDTNYRNHIVAKFNDIKSQIETFVVDESAGKTTAFLTEFCTVRDKIIGLEEDVRDGLDMLMKNIDGLADDVYSPSTENVLVKGALNKLEEAKNTLNQNTIQPITQEAEKLRAQNDEFQASIQKLAQKFQPLREGFYGKGGSTNPDENSLAKLITKLTTAIGNTGDTNGYGLAGAVNAFNTVAKAQIKEAAERAIKEAIGRFQMEGNDDDSKIKVPELMQLFEKSRSALTIAVQQIQVELGALKNIPNTVQQNQQTAEQIMDDLKTEITGIKEAITKINGPIRLAESAIESAIQTLEQSLIDAQSTTNSVLPLLRNNLQETVRKAFDELEDGVQHMFDAQKKAELNAIQTSVDDQIASLQSLIDTDIDTGLKGLMKRLNETFDQHNLHPSNTKLHLFGEKVEAFLTKFLEDVSWQEDVSSHRDRMTPLTSALLQVLSTMNTKGHFHQEVSDKIDALKRELDNFTPKEFAEASPLLNVIRRGVTRLHEELRKQYVSRYSGAAERFEWTKNVDDAKAQETVPSDKAMKCAKVFMTIMETLNSELYDLSEKCKNAQFQNIFAQYTKGKNPLGAFLENCGYLVSMSFNTYEGELRNNDKCNGIEIYKNLLTNKIENASQIDFLKKWKTESIARKIDFSNPKADEITVLDILTFLIGSVRTYYEVAHHKYIPGAKAPLNVYQMVCWLRGLRYNPMFNKINDHVMGLFPKPEEGKDGDPSAYKMETSEATITAADVQSKIRNVSYLSKRVLVAIMGHGHADGRYACDFYTNTDELLYPSSAGICFDMLVDVLNRIYHQFRFLYTQCNNGPDSSGWKQCWYGHGVGGSAWNCNADQCPNQMGNQPCNQKCGQTGNQHPKCGVKSPLQSYLEDGLPGFLPHSFSSPGCKLTCTMRDHFGKPCLTPMGFNNLGIEASHIKKGEHLFLTLYVLCGRHNSVLTRLCDMLSCLLRKTPQSLGDIFAFYHKFLQNYSGLGTKHRKTAFDDAVKKANFGDTNTQLNIAPIQVSKIHSDKHDKGDLYSLVECNTSKTSTSPAVPCGSYLQPLTLDIRAMSTEKHAEIFCALLMKLLDECCKNCNTPGSRCHDRSCGNRCPVKLAYESKDNTKKFTDQSHAAECHSIVICQKTHPTLYAYGFTFESPHKLSGRTDIKTRRTCRDFCRALESVLGKDSVLIELLKQIDNFLLAIRKNFMITLLALWSLSLLYLLHITVVRLDVLRIRSHLRSPSSHRIAAQSLLAAARVKALANVKYFSP
ncbi:hypothetical protein, conserved [Babesia ovata]|uniref:C3H1-type domain-containing protein n=1 Tax=Babesia ovata TaxID=189622 RepID=A0A2H6KK18_9APIC|nr:uncharacterized protein BOVATA_048300 [Babesia ovata]GBE63337.1 hypothetical protein, conserved [Babesia ovata]